MEMTELLEDENVQKIINEKLAAGQNFEVISFGSGEKVTSDELKQNIA